MSAYALNQIGQQSLTVTGIPVAVSLPTYTDKDPNHPSGIERAMTARHALIQCFDQPVRYASNLQGDPSGASGQLLAPDETLDLTDHRRDYYGFISNLKFVLDTAATGNATVEIAYFA
jgi:hypothetical protein